MIDSKRAFEVFLQEHRPSEIRADDYKSWREQMETAFIAGIDFACDKICDKIEEE